MAKTSEANAVTKAVITFLALNGWMAWRQGNHAVYDQRRGVFRKPPSYALKGVSDVLAIHIKTGKFMACEIKIGKDRLSPEQKTFLENIEKSGNIAMVVKSTDDFLKQYEGLQVS